MDDPMMTARVALVDDTPLLRLGLRASLRDDPRFRVVIDTSSADEVIALARLHGVDAAIVGLSLTAMEAFVAALRRQEPRIAILGLATPDEPLRTAQALRAGAFGYVPLRALPEVIPDALARGLRGERYMPPDSEDIERLANGEEAWPLERLTSREKEVFGLMVEGCSNDDIAERLFIARRTVETHRHRIMHKLAARSIVDLVRIALRSGIPVR